jgi:hypothetical protein
MMMIWRGIFAVLMLAVVALSAHTADPRPAAQGHAEVATR